MISAAFTPDFATWRAEARRLLPRGIPPEEVDWPDSAEESGLFPGNPMPDEAGKLTAPRVPAAFLKLAEEVMAHADPARRGLLYRMLWRLTRGGETRLLEIVTDPDTHRAHLLAKAVARDIHRMQAFVRFRRVEAEESAERERFVAWHEPEHHIVRLTAPFFARRFAGMDWSILTPKECAHWDGENLHFTPGVSRRAAPSDDELDSLWRAYYRNIFNPARLKTRAMRTSMPVKFWKNLPESQVIANLVATSQPRTEDMLRAPEREAGPVPGNAYLHALRGRAAAERPLEAAPEAAETAALSLTDLKRQAECCRACPLWEKATRTVFGEGPEDAALMIVGEQPGDVEDLSGHPFTGPAGKVLRGALREAGVDAERAYVTNAVKHFKWEPRGKRRLHVKPGRAEIHACRPWLLRERERVRPRVLLLLGATAAESLLPERGIQITRDRGELTAPELARRVILTFHPSYLLRLPEGPAKREAERIFLEDLRLAAAALAENPDDISFQ